MQMKFSMEPYTTFALIREVWIAESVQNLVKIAAFTPQLVEWMGTHARRISHKSVI